MSDGKRLSAAEVVAELRADEALYGKCNEGRYSYDDGINLGRSEAFAEAAELVEQHLVPQWQAEPTGDGLHHVQGPYQDWPVRVFDAHDGAGWWVHGWYPKDDDLVEVYEPLNGRRVCPISGPPSDAKGGA